VARKNGSDLTFYISAQDSGLEFGLALSFALETEGQDSPCLGQIGIPDGVGNFEFKEM
jgi:hypothetical protein